MRHLFISRAQLLFKCLYSPNSVLFQSFPPRSALLQSKTYPPGCLVTVQRHIQKWTHHHPIPFFVFPLSWQMAFCLLLGRYCPPFCADRGRIKAKFTQSVREIVTVWFLDTCNVSDCRRCVHAHVRVRACVCVYCLSVWCVCLSVVCICLMCLSISLVWKWKESLGIAVFNFNHYRDVPIWLSFLLPVHLRCT